MQAHLIRCARAADEVGTASCIPSLCTPPVSPRERVGTGDKTRGLLSHKMQPGGMP